MRVIKILTSTLLMIILFNIYPLSYGDTEFQKGMSLHEIAEIKRISDEAVNNSRVRSWVNSLEKITSFSAKKNKRQKASHYRRATVMILVSSSMSPSSVHRYLSDASHIKASVVMRGLINNSLSESARYIHLALGELKSGVSIDPIVFEKLNVHRVPVIVLLNQTGVYCLNTEDCTMNPEDYEVVVGNVTLDYALSVMAEKHSAQSKTATSLLQLLRDSNAV